MKQFDATITTFDTIRVLCFISKHLKMLRCFWGGT